MLAAMLPHFILLVGENPQRGTRLAGAQQHKARLSILGKVADRIRLIDLAAVY